MCDTQLIAHHIADGKVFKFQVKTQSLGLHSFLEHAAQLIAQGVKIEALLLQFGLSRLNAGQVQNIVDDGQQMLGQVLCPGEIFLRRRVGAAQTGAGQGHQAVDAVDGGADLVAHAGEKLCFGSAGRLGLLQLLGHLLLSLAQGGHIPQVQHGVVAVLRRQRAQLQPSVLPFAVKGQAQGGAAVPLLQHPAQGLGIGGAHQLEEAGDVPLHILQGQSGESGQVPGDVQGKGIAAAQEQIDLVIQPGQGAGEDPLIGQGLILFSDFYGLAGESLHHPGGSGQFPGQQQPRSGRGAQCAERGRQDMHSVVSFIDKISPFLPGGGNERLGFALCFGIGGDGL